MMRIRRAALLPRLDWVDRVWPRAMLPRRMSYTTRRPPPPVDASPAQPSHTRVLATDVTSQTDDAAHAHAVTTSDDARTGSMRTFWAHPVVHVPAKALKSKHAEARAVDRRSRFQVRQRIRDDGVLSNLYPITFAPERSGVFVYELYVTRDLITASADASNGQGKKEIGEPRTRGRRKRSPGVAASTSVTTDADVGDGPRSSSRVRHTQAWRAISLSLSRRMAVLPPMVALRHRLYTTAPLEEALLRVPETFWDLGWTCCELRPLGQCRYAEMPPSELQEMVNRIVVWATAQSVETTHAPSAPTGTHGMASEAAAASLRLSRERIGKFVYTRGGLTSAGVRVFRGCLVNAIFIDDSHASDPPPPSSASVATTDSLTSSSLTSVARPRVSARTLGESPEGLVVADKLPLRFVVEAFIRRFIYRGRHVESYRIADASGAYLASVWGSHATESTDDHARTAADATTAEPVPWQIDAVYAASRGVRIRDFAERGIRLIELDRESVAIDAPHAEPTPSERHEETQASDALTRASAPLAPADANTSTTTHPGQLALKIDTKGTMASESTIWEEVRQHFGCGPYSSDVQDRMIRAVQGTPVVMAYSLQQSIIRTLRFPSSAVDGQPPSSLSLPLVPQSGSSVLAAVALSRRTMDPALAALFPHLEPGQPYAVLQDQRLMPLQVLHCCFDPRMRGWQDVAVASLSFMPSQRAQHLAEYVAVLAPHLARWGLQLQREAWSTRHLALLPVPQKAGTRAEDASTRSPSPHPRRHPMPSPYPSTILVMGIVPERGTADERHLVMRHVQHMAQYFHTKLAACVPGEKEAVQHMVDMLLVPSPAAVSVPTLPVTGWAGEHVLRDPNSAALIVTLDKNSRGTRWVKAECLSRGVLPIAVAPIANVHRLKVFCAGVRRQLAVKFSTDPLQGVDLRREVPALGHRRVLLVGVDTCHTTSLSTGSIVAILSGPERSHVLPVFWRHEARGREVQHVTRHFRTLLAEAAALYDGLDEVVVFQDGDVHSELNAMKDEICASVPRCGFTFLCLHKRTNIRFMYNGSHHGGAPALHNVVKGLVVPALTPTAVDAESAAPSFYLQTHESNMSTARTVQYTAHHSSGGLDMSVIQQIANVTANVLAPQATKLPMCTRLAHRLADQAERLLDAVPQMRADLIPAPLKQRLWYL